MGELTAIQNDTSVSTAVIADQDINLATSHKSTDLYPGMYGRFSIGQLNSGLHPCFD
jgi:hypothetical protein